MPDETIHESRRTRSRRAIASYLRRVANALGRGKPVPADEAQTVTVDPSAEPAIDVEIGREDEDMHLDSGIEWPDSDGEIETDVVASNCFQRFKRAKSESGVHESIASDRRRGGRFRRRYGRLRSRGWLY